MDSQNGSKRLFARLSKLDVRRLEKERKGQMGNAGFIDTTKKAEDVAQHYGKGMHFVEELLRENERLRYKLIHLNQEMADISDGNGSSVMEMEDELSRLRALREMIQGQFENMKKENLDFRQRYTELEKQNENFMNLFVSSCQIHSSLDEEYILLTMQDIVLHMVGAEVFSVWMVDQDGGSLEILASTDECGQFEGRFPVLDISYSWSGKEKLAKVSIKQTQQPLNNVSTYHFPATIRRPPCPCWESGAVRILLWPSPAGYV